VVYGPTEDVDKVDFLNELSSVAPVSQMQWIVLGDFNMIYEARDKSNLNLSRQLMGRFRRALDRCKLFELALQNHKYTWSNDRAQPTLVRLDRVFCNKAWDLEYRLQALSSSLSDHSPLLLCHQDKPPVRDTFQFENFWQHVPGFKDAVQEAWNEDVPGISPMNVLFFKLQRTSIRLRQWSKALFGKARAELRMANEIIHKFEVVQESRQLSIEETLLRRDLNLCVLGLAAVERARRRQASRMTWLKEGDACTRFFHLKANSRSKKNVILCLKNSSGKYVWDHDGKEKVLYEHFSGILGLAEQRSATLNWAELELPRLPDNQLYDHFSEEEVKNAIAEMPSEKALGPDGFTGVFTDPAGK
jgi:hypothetical protein